MTRKERFGNFSWPNSLLVENRQIAAGTAAALARKRFYERREATVSPKLMGKRLVVRCPRAKRPHQSSAEQKRPAMEKSVEPQPPAKFAARPATS
jgi:hypothetical protein